MSELATPEEFAAFYREVHGRLPFAWQTELAAQIVSVSDWPQAIDVPTGLGKTSLIDIAVFAAARGVGASMPGRRRVFFVVDRRIVVDEAWHHACRLCDALVEAQPGSATSRVATRLSSLMGSVHGGCDPLVVTRMRGGVTWNWRWLARPDQAAIVTGTVDQIGSRLLFRGYGVGERLRPIDASLVGSDSLIIIDEAHLASPFVEALHALVERDCPQAVLSPRPLVVSMSATPTLAVGERVYQFNVAQHAADPIAAKRLKADKRLGTVALRTSKRSADEDVALVMAKLAERLADRPTTVVGVFANTVARARRIHRELLAHHEGSVLLVTGRSRPIDRESILARWLPLMAAGRQRPASAGPLFVVATQTLEVGANVDFDALVTENAALDALVQRLGRLNRFGDSVGQARCFVVAAVDPHGDVLDDPVYGESGRATWAWLVRMAPACELKPQAKQQADPGCELNVSPAALRVLPGVASAEMLARRPRTPVLLAPFLDLWCQTSPSPEPDIPVAAFLHGADEPRATVSVLWRADLPTANDEQGLRLARDLLETIPPVASEIVELPIEALRAWLRGDVASADGTDSDSLGLGVNQANGPPAGDRTLLRYDGSDRLTWVAAGQISAGDLLVAPASYGGLDAFGWAPANCEPVADVGDLARPPNRHVLRLHEKVLLSLLPDLGPETSQRLREMLAGVQSTALHGDEDDLDLAITAALREVAAVCASAGTAHAQMLARWVNECVDVGKRHTVILPRGNDGCEVIVTWQAADAAELLDGNDDAASAGSSFAGLPVTLTRHRTAVAERVEDYARGLGLPSVVRATLRRAGAWHDLGKTDPRFQAMLWGGDALLAEIAAEPLAKSGMDASDRVALRLARERSGYPAGLRHEALSARLTEALLADDERSHVEEIDSELLIHLVGAHHGWGRPLPAPIEDRHPVSVTVTTDGHTALASTEAGIDWQSPARFRRLNRRYGRWGLALLESCLRLADIACSEEGT